MNIFLKKLNKQNLVVDLYDWPSWPILPWFRVGSTRKQVKPIPVQWIYFLNSIGHCLSTNKSSYEPVLEAVCTDYKFWRANSESNQPISHI